MESHHGASGAAALHAENEVSMSVVLSQEDVGPWKKQLEIEVPAPAVDAELERVIGEFRKQVALPGFRKGKVPAGVVKQRFADEVKQEVIERLLPRYWQQAQSESQVEPMLQPEIASVHLEAGEPMRFVALVEVRPEIELAEGREFDLPPLEIDPTDSEIDEVIEKVRLDVAPWEPVKRKAGRGDLVRMRLLETTHGEDEDKDESGADEAAAEDGEEAWGQDVEVEVGDERVWEELTLALTGKKAGDEDTFVRVHEGAHHHDHDHDDHEDTDDDEDGAEEHSHTHEHSYRFKVLEVLEKQLPELDDEFAARVSDAETMEALRERVRQGIRADKKRAADRERETAVLDQLRERNPLELPQGVVGQEVEQMLRDYAENLARQGLDLEKAGIDWNGMREQMKESAEKRVHARLLLDAVVEQDEVSVPDERFDEILSEVAKSQQMSTRALRQALERDDRLEGFRAQVLRERALRQLLGEPLDEDLEDDEAGDESTDNE